MHELDQTKLKKEFGALVVFRRKSLGLSQEELAEKLGMQVRSLSKIENGHSFVTAETLCKFCKAFNSSPKSFFEFNNDKMQTKLNIIADKIEHASPEQIDFYFKLINLVEERF